ncbi:hypothetical protein [Pseudomonas sp. LBUM920]|jgi:hypothetical protein|uniref:hypothetical protein n=1 Tax=Pseudomonas sp. LBUM920 TaxID=2126069 RepID=UPI000F57C142|nr:hypothetical protein [Pseudomonas sp. LBUM920]AZF63782.1 hypothetical protein C4J83_2793 [Pseudomonas sp. LBUM920]
MADQKSVTEKEIEAWDFYAAAAITAIASRGPADNDELADEAVHYANAMLIRRRVKLDQLWEEN